MQEHSAIQSIPAHVPAHLVLDYPFAQGRTTTKFAHEEMVPLIHATYPDIFYARDAYPGMAPAWIPRRAADIRAVFLDTEHFSVQGFSPFAALSGGNWHMIPQEEDPPKHALYRGMINALFMPRAVLELKDKIRGYAQKYISYFEARGECEFMREFAFEYPITVILELLGLPQEMVGQFLQWEHGLLHESDIAKIAVASDSIVDYLRKVLKQRRAQPGSDVLSYAIQSKVGGESMTEDELLGFAFNLYAGGLDTVATMLGNVFRYLALHPEIQRHLRADPAQIPAGVDELVRLHAPTTTFRTCIKQIQLRDVTIMPGDKVALPTALGSRDPAEYDNPNDYLLGRNKPHLGFGFGNHRCLGVHLARLELTIAFEEFLGRIPEFRLAPDATIVTHLPNVIQIDHLPLLWSAT